MSEEISYFSSKKGFLGIAKEDAAHKPSAADAVVIPFGIEASVSYGGGTAKGPQAIIKASHQVELYDEELECEAFRYFRLATQKPIDIKKTVSKALDQLENLVEDVVAKGKFPLILGGEHSLTAGGIRPLVKRHKEIALLHFDAHADLRDGYEGEHFSHAAALRRCLDFPNVRLVSIGIRNISASEIPFLEANRDRISIFWAKDKNNWNIDEIVASLKGLPTFITFDVDGFDSSIMPATGTPEPGGILWWETLKIIRRAMQSCPIIGADIVELAPIAGWHSCDFLAAKLAYKILAYRFADNAKLK